MYTPSSPAPIQPRRIIRIPVTVIALVTIILCVAFVAACILVPRWFIDKHIEPTEPPPGNAAQFDPIQALPIVQRYAGEQVEFVFLEARFVRSDGTLDLTADYKPSPSVEYLFHRTVPPPPGTPPMGSGRAASSSWQQKITVTLSRPGQRFYVNRQSGGFKRSYNYVNKGMQRTETSPSLSALRVTPSIPVCSFRDIWQLAIQSGVPRDGVATITYDGEYRFQQYGSSKILKFGPDCTLRIKE